MRDVYLWADEAGDLTFSRDPNVSRYFIICTVSSLDLAAGEALSSLRRDMIRRGVTDLGDFFHATVEKQAIRDEVFQEILRHPFKVQATVCEKSKAMPKVRTSKARFYKYPWYYQFKFAIAPYLQAGDRLFVTAASIGTKKERLTFINDLRDVINQSAQNITWCVDFRPSQCDPFLQVADYCAWAIQRKWEKGDARSYDLIRSRITYEYDLWERGQAHHY